MIKTRLVVGAALCLLTSLAGRADEGNIPVFQSGVIASPGSYVLTRDITVSSGDAILIQSSSVTLDLKGHTIRNDGLNFGDYPIRIADGSDKIRILNGNLSGGWEGVHYGSGAATPSITIQLEELDIRDTVQDGIVLSNARSLEILSCKLRNIGLNAISVSGGNNGSSGRIENNEMVDVQNYGFSIGAHHNLIIRNNVVAKVKGGGMNVSTGYGDQFAGNVFFADPAATFPTVGLVLACESTLVQDNVFRGFSTGIIVLSVPGIQANTNRFVGNTITHDVANGTALGDAISISTERNLIEGNVLEDNTGCGIRLTATSIGNAWRNNIMRGNTGGTVCNTGSGNTDSGGNI